MKNLATISYIFITIISLILTGCASSETFRFQSPINGKLYLLDEYSSVSNVIASDPVKVTVPSSTYYGMVILNDAETGLRIPVGLNMHTRANPIGLEIAKYGGYFLLAAGIGAELGGLMMDKNGDNGLPSIAVGAAATLVGLGIAVPGHARLDQLAYDYRFCYDSMQKPNLSGLATKLLKQDPPKGGNPVPEPAKRKKAQSGDVAPEKVTSSKAKKTRNDLGQIVAGTYNGTGKLMKGQIVDEQYPSITLIIERLDKTSVKVTVVESDEDFFESPMIYDVASNGKKGYKLTMQGLPDATILITKEGVATYTHKKVNIDNELYSLVISAKKQK